MARNHCTCHGGWWVGFLCFYKLLGSVAGQKRSSRPRSVTSTLLPQNWSWKLEYLYLDLGSLNFSAPCAATTSAPCGYTNFVGLRTTTRTSPKISCAWVSTTNLTDREKGRELERPPAREEVPIGVTRVAPRIGRNSATTAPVYKGLCEVVPTRNLVAPIDVYNVW
jgi:hypothetical protein